MRVLLLTSNLEYGGAQRQIVALANRLNADNIETHVCCLSDYVPLACDLQNRHSRLHIVAKRAKFDATVVPRLTRLLHRLDINVLHSFLLDAAIAGRLAGRRHGKVAVIGSERNSNYKPKWHQALALRLTGRCMDALIANSNAGKQFQMHTFGIAEERLFVVHNGVDVDRFVPQPSDALCDELDISATEPVVGMFASFKKQKNHPMFFRVVTRLRERCPNTRFLCVGAQLHGGLQASGQYEQEMNRVVESEGLGDSVLFLGNRDDVESLYNLCDVTLLTSSREGTPNVLLESMACGTPVVATDVSDNRIIVPEGRAGHIVPLDDDEAMADRVGDLLTDDATRQAMGAQAREWVSTEFSLEALQRKTTAVYRQVLQRKGMT